MGQLTLVTGGIYSGKSAFARSCFSSEARVLFMATAQPGDDADLKRRIARHRSERSALWSTVEAPFQVAQVLGLCGYQYDGFLVDCIPEYMRNFLGRVGSEWTDEQILVEIDRLIGAIGLTRAPVVVETRDVSGVISPADGAARRLYGLIGRANQRLAQSADEIYQVVLGLPQKVQ